MKKKIQTSRKRLLSVLLAMVMVLTALPLTALSALAATSGDFEYEVLSETDKTCQITDYTGSATELAIPSELDGYTVTSIGYEAFSSCISLTNITIPDSVTRIVGSAFKNCTSLMRVTLPDSVTSIGGSAFYNCTSLASVTFPDSVTSIDDYAFSHCTSLTSITIPCGVTSIGGYTFYGCTALISIDVAADNANYTSIDGVLFNKSKTELIKYPEGKSETSYTVPDDVTRIGGFYIYDAFIGGEAFFGCTSLTSVTIPDSVTSIGDDAFRDCTSLTSVILGNSVTKIGAHVFSGCISLTSITIPNSVTSIGDAAFEDCTSLTSITIPDSVTSIGEWAFSGCSALTSITIPNSVTSIGSNTFSGCAVLTEINVGTGNSNFASVSGVLFNKEKTQLICYPAGKQDRSYAIPDSVTNISGGAFYDCASLATVTIPNSVTSIDNYTFENCAALTSIDVAEDNSNYASVNGIMFNKSKEKLIKYPAGKSESSYTVPDSVTNIGAWAFEGCTSLASVTIPNSVASIGWGAFENCILLTSITIPDSVTSIGGLAFSNSGLTTIYSCTDSYSETYANGNGYAFIALNLVKNDGTDISVVFPPENLPAENTVLNVKKISSSKDAITYDIALTVNGEAVQPASAVTVKIPVPETMDGAQCKVYRQETDRTYTDMQTTYQDGYMVFTTDHLSIYVVTTSDPNAIPTYTLGDVNGDDKINAVDARFVLQAASGARVLDDTQKAAADVNGDGKINAVDARWILQVASGVRTL